MEQGQAPEFWILHALFDLGPTSERLDEVMSPSHVFFPSTVSSTTPQMSHPTVDSVTPNVTSIAVPITTSMQITVAHNSIATAAHAPSATKATTTAAPAVSSTSNGSPYYASSVSPRVSLASPNSHLAGTSHIAPSLSATPQQPVGCRSHCSVFLVPCVANSNSPSSRLVISQEHSAPPVPHFGCYQHATTSC